jgi:large-conductance mechanosensitive channel
MEARATFGGYQVATGVLRMFIVAVLVALVVGGAGGYIVRALTVSVSTPTTANVTHRPFVVEQAPYSSPAASTAPEPTRDPNGNAFLP